MSGESLGSGSVQPELSDCRGWEVAVETDQVGGTQKVAVAVVRRDVHCDDAERLC